MTLATITAAAGHAEERRRDRLVAVLGADLQDAEHQREHVAEGSGPPV